eukprot:6705160-Pyramimonas_sp.AAC.1
MVVFPAASSWRLNILGRHRPSSQHALVTPRGRERGTLAWHAAEAVWECCRPSGFAEQPLGSVA